MLDRQELVTYCDQLLKVAAFRDYCPNGLQVEGAAKVKKIVTGVTASAALIEAAIDLQADTLIVHHGYFWKGESACLTGIKGRRIKQLMQHDINLLAYHLPLDAHPSLGNNAQLGRLLGLQVVEGLDSSDHPVGSIGKMEKTVTAEKLREKIATVLQREPMVIGDPERVLGRIAWCTGAAQSMITQAYEKGADCYITGEISEQTVHQARELDMVFVAAGHHATERYGVKALGEHLKASFPVEVTFVDIDNPV